MKREKTFVEISARFDTLEQALEWAHTLDANGVREISVDNGDGYGLRECAAEGCGAILAYPDEGAACEKHTCAACGVVVDALAVFSLPWRDDAGAVYLDDTATACLTCYAAIMETLSPDRMLRVDYYPRHRIRPRVDR